MAQMFHDKMGQRVLNLTASMHSEGLRTYAHCEDGQKGLATLLLINVSPTKTFTMTLPPPHGGHYEIFEFSAGDGSKPRWNGLDSQHIRLNGELLTVAKRGELPELKPRISTSAEIDVKPLTISFVSVPAVAACM